jgi:Helix-turn-helix domain
MGPGQPGPAGPGHGPGQFTQHPYGPAPGTGHPQGQGAPGAGRLGDTGTAPPGPRPATASGFERAGGPIIRQRDSALPDPPAGGGSGPIAAIETDNIAAFARDLRVLRAKAGLDYPDMAEKSHYTMRTLASAAGGLRLPTLPVLIAYVRACGAEQTEWEERWGKLMRATDGQAALPAAGADATADGPAADPSGGSQAGGSSTGTPAPGAASPPPSNSDEVYVITSAPARDDRW